MDLPFYTISDLDLGDKTVLMRVDINSPINPETGDILSLKRLEEHARSIKKLPVCKLVLLAHHSRPGKKGFTGLSEHAKALSRLLDRDVRYIDTLYGMSAIKEIGEMKSGDIILLENTRFYSEEVSLKNASMDVQSTTHIVQKLAEVGDVFINDAFSAVHRSQPSLVGFSELLPCCAGPLLEKEVQALVKVTESPERPSIAILGGLKVDDSINVAEYLLSTDAIDRLLTTGVVGSMFLWAKGYDLGTPNVNFIKQEIPGAEGIIERCKKMLEDHGDKIMYPLDMALNIDGKRKRITIEELPAEYPIFDISIDTIVSYSKVIKESRTIVANGPAGVFEMAEFSEGTKEIFRAINRSSGYSVMGGGETNVVVKTEKLVNIDHVSTGGGALISYLSGKTMPVIDALKRSREMFPDLSDVDE